MLRFGPPNVGGMRLAGARGGPARCHGAGRPPAGPPGSRPARRCRCSVCAPACLPRASHRSSPPCLPPLQVVDHYEKPRNVGSFDKADPNVGTGLVGAPACGDVMKLQIRVDEAGNIVDSCFKTFGCGSAIASSSVATEW